MDIFIFLVSTFIFIIYSVVCFLSVIFTFSLDTYRRIDAALNVNLFSVSILNPLMRHVYVFESWLMRHHKFAGLIMVASSIFDIKLAFDFINRF